MTKFKEPYDVKVTNVSGLSATFKIKLMLIVTYLETASGQIGGSLYEGDTVNISATATDPDGDTVFYSVQSGSFVFWWIFLNSSTGAISGTLPSVSKIQLVIYFKSNSKWRKLQIEHLAL